MITGLLCLFAAAIAVGAQGENKPRLAEEVGAERERTQKLSVGKRIRLAGSTNGQQSYKKTH